MGRLALVALLCNCSYAPPRVGIDPRSDAQETQDPDASSNAVDALIDSPPGVPMTTSHIAGADTWLESDQPNLNHAVEAFVITDGDIPATSLLRFDLAALGTGQVLTAALHIFTDFDPGAEVQIFRVLEPWTEGGATWNQRMGGVSWAGVGASPPSVGTTAIGTFTPSTADTEYTVAIDPATIAVWLADPAANFGMAISSVNANGPRFRSREAAVGKPVLRVTQKP